MNQTCRQLFKLKDDTSFTTATPESGWNFTRMGTGISTCFSVFVVAALFLFIFWLSACNESSQYMGEAGKEPTITEMDLPLYTLPEPGIISKEETQRIQSACQTWYDSTLGLKGFSGGIIVAKKGRIIFEKYNGTRFIPGTELITASTPLHIASVTKTFTAMGILKLWQDGLLDIDKEVSEYLPGFNYPGVTIRSLLNHRSGLPNYLYFFDNLGWDKTRMATNTDVLNYLNQYKAQMVDVRTPNINFSYNNTNYALLALIAEKVTGKSFGRFLSHQFFKPLQMKNTFVFSINDTSTATASYDWKGRWMPFNHLDLVYGDKNIYTTPQDLLIWDRALRSNLIFKPETLQQAYAPYSNEKPGIKNYGLGWRMNIYPTGKKMIFHNGWWHGSNAVFVRLLEEDATIIVIGNKFTRSIYSAQMLANLFGEYYTIPEEENGESESASDSLVNPSSKPIFPQTKIMTKKDSALRAKFRDQNKVNNGNQ